MLSHFTAWIAQYFKFAAPDAGQYAFNLGRNLGATALFLTSREGPRWAIEEEGEQQEIVMPQGDKSSYTSKQKRMAEHIEEGYEKRGTSKREAERRAWATVNKETHGGKKSGSGRGRKGSKTSSRKGGRKAGRNKKR